MVVLMCRWLLAAVLLAGTGKTGYHPFYVSVTEIEQQAAGKSLEISCKMFTDDLEKAIREEFHTSIDLLQPKDSSRAQKLVGDYIVKHLRLQVNGKLVLLRFIGFEKESGTLWSYLEADQAAPVKRIDIRNDLLYKQFDKQIGILHVTINGSRKSTRLNYPETDAGFSF